MGGFAFILVSAFAYLAYVIVATNPAQVQYKRAMEFLREKNYFDAEQFFLKAIESDPLHIQALSELAKLYEEQGMVEKALKYLKKLHSAVLNPFDRVALNTLMNLSMLLYNTEKYKEAWEGFLLLFRMGFQDARMFFYLGELFMIQRRYAEAINLFDESLALDKNNNKAVFYKALCLISMKEKTEAVYSLKNLENDAEFGTQSLFLLGKIHFDLGRLPEAGNYFSMVLREKNPLYLKDILLYKGYEILLKDDPSEEDISRAIQLFNRGCHLKNIFSDIKKEFLYHLGGCHLLRRQFSDAKTVFRDLCRIDAYYKEADQILKAVSKELLIKEEHGAILEKYQKYQKIDHYRHEILQPVKPEEFFPTHLPLLVLDKMEQNAQKKLVFYIQKNTQDAAKLDFHAPKTPLEFSSAQHQIFEETCVKICQKLGVIVDKNISPNKTDVIFLGIDKGEARNLMFFSKPAAMVGAIAITDAIDQKEKMSAIRLSYFSPGSFTEDARKLASQNQVSLYDKNELKRLL